MRIAAIGLVGSLVAACSGSNKKTPIDAPVDVAIDAPPPDALVDAPAPPTGEHRYVVDKETLPTNNAEARALGLDLNNDGTVDNQLGMVIGTLSTQGFEVQVPTDTAVDKGMLLQLADFHADDLAAGPATFTLYDGANPMPAACGANDTVCRHHLMGTATFDLAATSAHDPPLAGTITGGVFTETAPGALHVQSLALLGAPTKLALTGAKVKLTMLADGTLGNSIIAGGIPATEIDQTVMPSLQQGFMALVTRDCTNLANPPDCGCAAGSTGKTVLGLFDAAPQDCMISVDEVRNNSLIKSLFTPDITLDGMPCLSFGFGIHAVHAAFTP